MKPYIRQNNKKVNDNNLRITEITDSDDCVVINIEHWDFKWIEIVGVVYYEKYICYEFHYTNDDFRNKWKDKVSIFELIIPNKFIDIHNLNNCHFHRIDKYETDILFLKNKKVI